ncbi:MAG: flippase-like domain-containing protein [Minwuiales bacterium]|nr:flippase-like domain-containing protein [Minwuiales bacterium]
MNVVTLWQHNRGRLLVGLKVSLSIALLYWLATNADLSVVRRTITGLTAGSAAIAVLFLVIVSLLAGLRWVLVMRAIGAPIGLRVGLSLTFISVFFNQVLPTSVGGDAVRIWQTLRLGYDRAAAIGSTVVERLIGLSGLAVLVLGGVWHLGERIDNPSIRIFLIGSALAILAGATVLALLDRLAPAIGRQPWLNAPATFSAKLRGSLKGTHLMPKLIGISILSHVIAACTVYVLSIGLGLTLSLIDAVALIPAVIMISMIPFSFAGWGLREGAMVALLTYADVPTEAAFGLSVLFGLSMLTASLPGYALWLFDRKILAVER